MKALHLLLLALLFPGLEMAAAVEPVTLRVLCYNIHFGRGTDDRTDIPRLAEVIKAAKPDLVALQEVDVGVERSGRVHQVLELGRLTGMSARFGPTQDHQGGLYGNAILTRLPVLDTVIHPLPYSPWTREVPTYPRGVLAVTVQAPDGEPLRLVSTHFQHNSEKDRIDQARAINRLFAADGDPLRSILAGDLNARPDEKPIAILEEMWGHAIDDARAPSAPAPEPESRIDYILQRPAAAFRVVRCEVIPEKVASDHRPVLAVLELTGR